MKMRRTAWIWFTGFGAWLFDSMVNLRFGNWIHARLALGIAILFFAAGLFYRRQS
jgi:hypothetical protein